MEYNQITSFTHSILNSITTFKNGNIEQEQLNILLLFQLSQALSSSSHKDGNTSSVNSSSSSRNNDSNRKDSLPQEHCSINNGMYYLPFSLISFSTEMDSQQLQKDNPFNKVITDYSTSQSVSYHEINFSQCPITLNSTFAQSQLNTCDNNKEGDIEYLLSQLDVYETKDLFYTDYDTHDMNSNNNNSSNNDHSVLLIRRTKTSTCLPAVPSKTKASHSFTCHNLSTDDSSGDNNNSGLNMTTFKLCSEKDKLKQEKENLDNVSPKIKATFSQTMNKRYINYVYMHYNRIITSVHEINSVYDNPEANFISAYKRFITSMGVSVQNVFNVLVREVLLSKDKSSFEDFISSFNVILNLKGALGLLKFKFLLNISNVYNEEYMSLKDIESFMDIIQCKQVYESGICSEIINKMIFRYKQLYFFLEEKKNISNELFHVKKLEEVLETFY